MTETLAVIGLDAADYALLKRWDCQHILLDNNKMLETFTASKDVPLTTEVWPTVATGLPPKEHGLVATGEQQSWDNPILNLISSITSRVLSDDLRKYAGEVIRDIRGNSDIGMTLSQTDAPHPFYKGGIFGWPGLTDAENLLETWRWLDLNKRNKINEKEILRRLYENAGNEVGWLLGLNDFGYPVLGVHMHILDATGHVRTVKID